ncbi:hypothetical protein EUTSA_v10000604mg, partial [Eutrema salsugineum]
MKMSDLPLDLVDEILSRISATSMSTCKRWNLLFKDPGFSKKHLRKTPKQYRVLMLKDYKLYSMSLDHNVFPSSIEFKYALSLKYLHYNSGQVDIVQVFHCDGLLLCITRERRWIQHKSGYGRYIRFALGYENNNQSCRSYKILRSSETNGQVRGFEIYEFSSNSWRVVNAPNGFRIGMIFFGVCLKGNTWLPSDSDDNKDKYLLSFDFTRERFRRLCLPQSLYPVSYMALSSVREEQLSLITKINYSAVVELWVTNKVDDTEAELSWIKSLA